MDSWKSQSFGSLSNAKILVVSKSPDPDVRKSYELAIANRLRSQGFDAVESHIELPSLQDAHTPQEIENTIQLFMESGITGIILTSLKQTIKTHNSNLSSQVGIPESYADKSSFGQNAGSLDALPTSTSTTYVLEALIYNLALAENNQLVNVCLVDVTDPHSGDNIRKTFTKIIGDQFK
ncbi:MAG: hypothetical protein ACR2MT_11625 [Aurantibacter sp.]